MKISEKPKNWAKILQIAAKSRVFERNRLQIAANLAFSRNLLKSEDLLLNVSNIVQIRLTFSEKRGKINELNKSVSWRRRRWTVFAEQENRVKSTDGTAAVSDLENSRIRVYEMKISHWAIGKAEFSLMRESEDLRKRRSLALGQASLRVLRFTEPAALLWKNGRSALETERRGLFVY